MLNQSLFPNEIELTERKLELDSKILRCLHGKRPCRSILPAAIALSQVARLCMLQLEQFAENQTEDCN